MIKNKKIIAIILARGGSKRLPGKNIKMLNKKPLITWSIEAAQKSKYIDKLIVSTDSQEISNISKNFGADVPFLRPKNISQDITTSEDTLLHVLKWIKDNEEKKYDYFILLQPTSPLRTAKHIDEAITLFDANKDADTLVSITKNSKNPYWLQKINKKGYIQQYFKPANNLSELYIPNGAIFIGKAQEFIKTKKLYTSKTIGYTMDKMVSIDIDNELDFKLAELLLSV